MSLFDKSDSSMYQAEPPSADPTNPARLFTLDRARMFQIAGTATLTELFTVPRANRTAAWAGAFYTAAWTASLELATPNIFRGPDGFEYIRLQIPTPNQRFGTNCIANVVAEALERILGIAIFASPQATEPDIVLSMGILSSLLTYDSWDGDPQDRAEIATTTTPQTSASGMVELTSNKGQQIMIGSPAASFLPPHTARALHRHLNQGWGLPVPRIALMINPAIAPTRNLVIGKKMSQFPNPETAGAQGRSLLWYLPPRRGLLLMPESWTDSQLQPLTDFFPPPASRSPTQN